MRIDETTRRQFLASLGGGALLLSGAGSFAQAEQKGGSKMIVHTDSPMNAEPVLGELVKNWMTPTDKFYIRSHAPIPKIDNESYRLKIEGLVDKPLSLSLAQLAKLKQHSVVATLTCAGNRRTEHSLVKPVKGVPWGAGAIGNARWGGALLSTVLKMAEVKSEAKHVWFEGLDQIERSSGIIPFGASIPLARAIDDQGGRPGALLTTSMNDAPLNGDHGAPLRTVVPSYIGARSVKWLGRIVVSDRPSPNHYVSTAYKIVEDGDPVEWSEQGPIYRMPLNSAICTPSAGNVKAGKVPVAGYALPPGRPGATIAKVEVSVDDGRSWIKANIDSPARANCWVLWSAQVQLKQGQHTLTVRATDSRGKTQPQHIDWNQKGYLFNAWHSVKVRT